MIKFGKALTFFLMIAALFSCKNETYVEAKAHHEGFGENGYVGASTCIECHKEEYESWEGSHHELAMQIANDSTVLGDFNNIEANIDGVNYFFYKENTEFYVRVKEIDGSEKEYKIGYTFGITPLQQYLVDFEDGKKQVLRVTWDVLENRWYHQYKGDQIKPDDWLHWTQGAQNWNTMCAECHSTNLEKNYDVDTDSFQTTYAEINVACESCHGPAKNHNEWAANDPTGKNFYILNGISQDEQINQCAVCHARRVKLTPNLEPGEKFENQYMVQNLSTNYYHGDGQIMEEDFVLGSFMQSKMYEEGVTCSNCHNPHSLELKFEGNRLCLQCHVPADYDTKSHHFHAENTEAGLCINCHMTGEIYMGNDYRRDHSFRIPRPDQSIAYDTPNACNQCHEDKTNSWATNAIKEWYGDERPAYFSDELLLSSHSDLKPEERRKLEEFIVDTKKPDIARATIIENLNFRTESDYQVLMSVLRDTSAIVKYQALMKFRTLTPEVRTSIALEHLNDSTKLVRVGAAQLLIDVDENSFNTSDKINRTKSLEELETMLFSNADFSTGRMQLGDYYFQKGDFNKAITHYKMALQKDRLLTPVYSNLATAYSILKDYSMVIETLDEWIALEPSVGRPYYLKGLMYFETGQFSEAISALKFAIKLDPNDTRSMYNIATYYYQDNKDLAIAEKYAKDALKIQPENGDFKYLLALIYQNTGQMQKAEKIMRELNPGQ